MCCCKTPPTATLEDTTIRQYGASEDGWLSIVALASADLMVLKADVAVSVSWNDFLECLPERRSVRGCNMAAQFGMKRR